MRRFLEKGTAVLFLLICSYLTAHACEPFERELYAMGTSLRITVEECDSEKAIAQTESYVRIVENAENQLSTWRASSELSRLNRHPTGDSFPASESLIRLFKKIAAWHALTQGAFDPTIGRLAEAWKIHGEFHDASTEEIQQALQNTGYKFISIDDHAGLITKTKSVILDAGGFGKGEALDRVLEKNRQENLPPVFLDFGGQVAAGGSVRNEGWPISLADPKDRTRLSSLEITLKYGSVSTSGGSERDGYAEGKRIGHILDPSTGVPVPSFGSVSVWHPDALAADILSTALYVMGPELGYEWALREKIAACFLMIKEKGTETRMTPGFKALQRSGLEQSLQ